MNSNRIWIFASALVLIALACAAPAVVDNSAIQTANAATFTPPAALSETATFEPSPEPEIQTATEPPSAEPEILVEVLPEIIPMGRDILMAVNSANKVEKSCNKDNGWEGGGKSYDFQYDVTLSVRMDSVSAIWNAERVTALQVDETKNNVFYAVGLLATTTICISNTGIQFR